MQLEKQMRLTPRQTAILLVIVLNASGQTRARLSASTIKHLAGRTTLKYGFFNPLVDEMADFDWTLVELASGYAAIRTPTLEAAKPVTAKNWLPGELKIARKNGKINFEALEKKLAPEVDDDSDADENPDKK
jgi:hypothetical protein